MGLTITGKTIKKSGAVTPDYSELLEGKPLAKAGKIGHGNLEIKKVNNKDKTELALANEEHKVGKPVMINADQLAHVSVTGGQTINLGNFESVKIQVGVTLPSHIHALEETFEFASDWVSTKMEEAVKSIKG